MKKNHSRSGPAGEDRDTMRAEYDFGRAKRGATAARYSEGTNLVLISPDLVDVFPDAATVNDALRALAPLLRRPGRSPSDRSEAGQEAGPAT